MVRGMENGYHGLMMGRYTQKLILFMDYGKVIFMNGIRMVKRLRLDHLKREQEHYREHIKQEKKD
jgi:hypothetical protein